MMDPPCPRGTLAPLHTVKELQTSSLRTKGPSKGGEERLSARMGRSCGAAGPWRSRWISVIHRATQQGIDISIGEKVKHEE